MNLLFLLASFAFAAAPGDSTDGTWKGYISDRRCGTVIDPDCNKRCFEEGQPAVLVTDDKGDLIDIANTDAVKAYPGAHVTITGVLKDGKLTVRTVKPIQ